MLVQHVMTRNVITVTTNTSVGDAQKIMKEHNFRRLPVVDKKGRLVGLVTEPRLERVKPSSTTPLLWQISYIISHTTVADVMRKKVVTVKPTDTVEHAVGKAQKNKVGTLVVVDSGSIVGICTTNDFFYKITNPTLGIGESGVRILIPESGDGHSTEKIIHCINELGLNLKLIWTSPNLRSSKADLTLGLDIEDTTEVVNKLAELGFTAFVRQR